MINHDLPDYTITIDYIIRGLLNTDFEHTITYDEIQKVRPLLFTFDYPLSDKYKFFFESAFIMHFMYREIAVTPLSRWKTYLMEYCFNNSAYIESVLQTAEEKVNYLKPFTYHEESLSDRNIEDQQTSQSDTTTDSTGTNKNNDKTTQITSTFPQATLGNYDYASGSLEDESINQSETENNSKISGRNENTRTGKDTNRLTIDKEGNTSKSYGELMREFYLYNTTITGKLWSSMSYLFFSVY